MRRGFLGSTHIDFHVPEPADIPEASPLLPKGADGLTAQGGLTVPEGTGISLQNTGNQQKKKGKKTSVCFRK